VKALADHAQSGANQHDNPGQREGVWRISLAAAVRAQLGTHAVDVASAAFVLGVSERQFYELRKREDFPRARRHSERVSRYLVAELLAWLAEQPISDDRAEPPQLARGRVYRNGRLVSTGQAMRAAEAAAPSNAVMAR
jgi:predicted DNA-binding transcriptional regulator AlpA